MENIDLTYAREHLSELIERAAGGEDVRIVDPRHGSIKLTPVAAGAIDTDAATGRPKRIPGRLAGRFKVPAALFDPLPEDELKLWCGDKE